MTATNALAVLPNLLAHSVVYVGGGLGVVAAILLVVLLLPAAGANGGPPTYRVNYLWLALLVVLILIVIGFIP